MWAIFKAFIEFVTILFLFYGFLVSGCEAYGILAPWPGIEPTTTCIGRWRLNHQTTREVPRPDISEYAKYS